MTCEYKKKYFITTYYFFKKEIIITCSPLRFPFLNNPSPLVNARTSTLMHTTNSTNPILPSFIFCPCEQCIQSSTKYTEGGFFRKIKKIQELQSLTHELLILKAKHDNVTIIYDNKDTEVSC